MFLPILLASALTIADVPHANKNTVHYFDNEIHVTQRVLDGTIFADVRRVQQIREENPSLEASLKAIIESRINRYYQPLREHCRRRLDADGYANVNDCGHGF